jgi:hypothetical protein
MTVPNGKIGWTPRFNETLLTVEAVDEDLHAD